MVTPDALSSAEARYKFSQLMTIWRDAETTLTRLIAEAVARDLTEDVTRYTNNLGMVRRLMRDARKVIKQLEATGELTQAMFEAEYQEAAVTAGGGPLPAGINNHVVTAVAMETATLAETTHGTILRQVGDTYRQVMQQAVFNTLTTGQTREQVAQQALNRFADKGIVAFKDAAGRLWSMDSYVEMAIRTGVNNAQNLGRRDGYTARGINLIVVSTHKACAPQCLPYQGKILAVNGPAGTHEMESIHGGTIKVHVTATLEEALRHGYHHPNCRHTDTAYLPGMTMPKTVETDERDYELLQRQRQLERNIRRWKLRQAAALTPEAKQLADTKVRQWQAAIREHVAQEDWLVRQYQRERTMTGRRGVA